MALPYVCVCKYDVELWSTELWRGGGVARMHAWYCPSLFGHACAHMCLCRYRYVCISFLLSPSTPRVQYPLLTLHSLMIPPPPLSRHPHTAIIVGHSHVHSVFWIRERGLARRKCIPFTTLTCTSLQPHSHTLSCRLYWPHGSVDSWWGGLAQSTPPVCPHSGHNRAYNSDDRGGPLATLEYHGVIGEMGRGCETTCQFPADPRTPTPTDGGEKWVMLRVK